MGAGGWWWVGAGDEEMSNMLEGRGKGLGRGGGGGEGRSVEHAVGTVWSHQVWACMPCSVCAS